MNPAIQFLEHLIDKPEKLFGDYIYLEELKQSGGISLNNFVVHTKEDKEITIYRDDPLEMYDNMINNKKYNINVINDSNKPKNKKKNIKNVVTKNSSVYLEFN